MAPQNGTTKPKSVTAAANLLWASLALGLVKVLLDFGHISASVPIAGHLFFLALTIAILSSLVFKIMAGRNWARITFLVLYLLGLLPTLSAILDEWARAPVIAVISVAHACMQGYALLLLFSKPAAAWFKKTPPA